MSDTLFPVVTFSLGIILGFFTCAILLNLFFSQSHIDDK